MIVNLLLPKKPPGYHHPDTAKENPQGNWLLLVRVKRRTNRYRKQKAGDVVLYGKYAGTEISVEGEELPDHEGFDILAIV